MSELFRTLITALLLTGPLLMAPGVVGASMPAISIEHLEHQLIRDPAAFRVAGADSSLQTVRQEDFEPLDDSSVNRGISAETYWVRFRLENPGNEPRRWVLHHETSYLDNMTIHYADNDGAFEQTALSDRRPFRDRPIAYRTLAFAHTTPAQGHTDVFVRLSHDRADSVSLNLNLSEATRFAEDAQTEYIIFGIYYGVMAILLLIALLGAILLRQVVYLHYALFLMASTLMWAALNGFAFQYLWPGSPALHNEGYHVLFLLTALSALQFSRHFLKTRERFPRFNRIVTGLHLVMVAGIVLRFLGVYVPVLALSFGSLALLAGLPVIGYMAWRRGQRYARWYALAWAVYGIGLLVSVLSAGTPLFNWGMDPLVFTQISGVLESVLLLVALGERLILWEQDRRQALAMARQDALTGLYNRRIFPRALDYYRDRFTETGNPVYLIMIDLDHFKELNDEYGHDAGDRVLKEFGQLLQRHCRPGDTCLRYGGEEFALLVQVHSLEEALTIAERIRRKFAEQPTHYHDRIINHTLTAGLAPILCDEYRVSADDLIREADAALYQAKAEGRNRTVVFEAPSAASEGTVYGR